MYYICNLILDDRAKLLYRILKICSSRCGLPCQVVTFRLSIVHQYKLNHWFTEALKNQAAYRVSKCHKNENHEAIIYIDVKGRKEGRTFLVTVIDYKIGWSTKARSCILILHYYRLGSVRKLRGRFFTIPQASFRRLEKWSS